MANLIIKTPILLHLLLVIFLSSTNAAAVTFNVLKYGAKSNIKIDSTRAFLLAWSSACKSKNLANIYVPRGRYLIRKAVFSGPCRNTVIFMIDGTLVAPNNYWIVGNSGDWILFDSVNGLGIYGGTLDGRGSRLYSCKRSSKNCPQGAKSLAFNNARNVVISGVTSVYSQMSHIAINGCQNMVIRKFKLIAPDQSPNTDGIDIQSSSGITIIDSSIKTGDDCIAIGPGTRKLLIQRVKCGPGHCISIGSLARSYNEEGVQDITVKDVVFTRSDNGLRIKTWPRPSTGFVKNVLYQNIVMNNVKNPIIIDQRYCDSVNGCPNEHSGIDVSGVTYQNVLGTSASAIAVNLHCSSTNPCKGIKMDNVKLTYSKTLAKSFCKNADGKASGFVMPGSCL